MSNAKSAQHTRLSPKKLVTAVALLVASTGLHAQDAASEQAQLQAALVIPLDQPTPLSPLVHTGKFANGLSYYIRENAEPKNRAELRLVINAGSILEDDDQLGLAHFLEHMAFNGTENFEKQEITRFMESIGMRFGAEINASTSFDETIYKLTVPSDKPANMETAFQIMDDWATAMTLDPEEIEKERGVVIEEWRGRQGAGQRIQNQQMPVMLKDSRYVDRLPIGTLENLQNFSPDVLRRFYKDWYRPDLMSVIAVGDFDAATVEKLLREHFENIPAAENPRARETFNVPTQPDTQIVVITDPEMPSTQVAVSHKMPNNPDWSVGGYRQRLVERLYNAMLSTRFAEMTRQPNPPFMQASSSYSALVRPIAGYTLAASVQETGINHGLEVLLAEAERVSDTGFTAAELDRIKLALLRSNEQSYANRASRSSGSHADEMIRAYLTGESIPGPEYEMAMTNRFVPTITLAEVNQVGKNWISTANRVVTVVMPQKQGVTPPTSEELATVIANTGSVQLAAREETGPDLPLVATVPAGSKVVATRELEGDITEWTLGNGIKVVLKPTDFRQDELLMTGFSQGGTSLISDEDYIPATSAVTLIANGGVGSFNAIALGRKLTGKLASVSPYISEFEEGVQGRGSPADLETMLQLVYLRMTAPLADSGFFEIFKTQSKAALQNRTVNPGTALDDAFLLSLYNNHPRRQPPSVDMIDKANLERSLEIYQDRLGDATDMTFIFVGNIDKAKMQPLVETWIGGLPVSGRKETWKDLGIRPVSGAIDLTVNKGIEPKSSTRITYTGAFNVRSLNERTVLSAATQVLQNRLTEVMREELGGTYGVQVSRSTSWQPVDSYSTTVSFGSDPQRAEEMANTVFAEIDRLKTEGPTESEVANVRQAILRSHETGLLQNNAWMAALNFSFSSGISEGVTDFLQVPKAVEAVTVDSVRKALTQYYNRDNHIRVTLLPEKA